MSSSSVIIPTGILAPLTCPKCISIIRPLSTNMAAALFSSSPNSSSPDDDYSSSNYEMDHESANTKRTFDQDHNPRPRYGYVYLLQLSLSSKGLVIISLKSHPRSFSKLSFADKKRFLSPLTNEVGFEFSDEKWSPNDLLLIYPISHLQKKKLMSTHESKLNLYSSPLYFRN